MTFIVVRFYRFYYIVSLNNYIIGQYQYVVGSNKYVSNLQNIELVQINMSVFLKLVKINIVHSWSIWRLALELSNFDNFDVYWRRKYAEFCKLSLKIRKIKIQPMSWLKTQLQIETFTQNSEKFLTWYGHLKLRWIK